MDTVWGLLAPAIIVLGLGAFVLLLTFGVVVKSGHVAFREGLDSRSRKLKGGVHVLLPIVESLKTVYWVRREQDSVTGAIRGVVHQIQQFSTKPEKRTLPVYKCTTSDDFQVEVLVSIEYKISSPRRAAYQTDDLYSLIDSKVENEVLQFASQRTKAEACADANILSDACMVAFKDCGRENGLTVTRVTAESIRPSLKSHPDGVIQRSNTQKIEERKRRMSEYYAFLKHRKLLIRDILLLEQETQFILARRQQIHEFELAKEEEKRRERGNLTSSGEPTAVESTCAVYL